MITVFEKLELAFSIYLPHRQANAAAANLLPIFTEWVDKARKEGYDQAKAEFETKPAPLGPPQEFIVKEGA